MTSPNDLPPELLQRQDESPDELFYDQPRLLAHIDDEAIAAVYQAVQDGLITPEEATDFVLGRLL